MARPTKQGLDYFPLDVVMDDKINLIEAEHGIVGFGLLIKLFQKIYSEDYFYPWTEKEQLLFSNRVSVDRNTVVSIVNDCIKWGIFNEHLYEKYKILTSKGIQTRYLNATYKRASVIFYQEYLLIDVSDRKNTVITSISDVRNPEITIVSDSKSTQSKVKKSKVKKRTKDSSLQIENLRQRYSQEKLKLIDEYVEILKSTRVSNKLADSVLLKVYIEMSKHPEIVVGYACHTVINNPALHSKKENYFFGIMRNTKADEAARKLDKQKIDQENYGINLRPEEKYFDVGG
jgi:uncharacterized protein YqkB